MPGSLMSSMKFPLPRIRRGSSLRLIECPMPPTSGDVFGAICPPLAPLGGELDGLHDVHVAGAAAQIPGDRLADVLFAWLRVAAEQGVTRHHHARGAEAALEAVLLEEPLLNRIELAVFLES